VRLEGHEANDPAVRAFGDPQGIVLETGVVETQASGQLDGGSDVFGAGFPCGHFRLLYHADRGPRRAAGGEPGSLDSPRLGK
jgi:hypothetical protein